MDTKLSLASSATWADAVEDEEAELGKLAVPLDRPIAGYGRSPPQSRSPRGPSYSSAVPPPGALPDAPPYKAYIGNIPYDLDEELVEHFFKGLSVREVLITRHRDTGRAKGCFVEFASQQDLGNALTLDGADMARRAVRVQVAEPRSGGPPPRGGGGFFDRGAPPPRRYEDNYGDSFSRPRREERDNYSREPRGSSGGGGAGGSNWGQPGGGPSYSSRDRDSRDTYEPTPAADPGRERPKLVLQPRTAATETPDGGPTSASPTGKANPFGSARPADTAAKLKEFEERAEARRAAEKEARIAAAAAKKEEASADAAPPPPPTNGDPKPPKPETANGEPPAGAKGARGPVKILARDAPPKDSGGAPASGPPPGLSRDGGRGRGGGRAWGGRGGVTDAPLPHHRQGEEDNRGGRGRGRSGRGERGRGDRGGGRQTEGRGRGGGDKDKPNPKAVLLDEEDKPKTKVSNVFDVLGGADSGEE